MSTAITLPHLSQLEKVRTLTVSIISPETEAQARLYLTDVRLAGKQLDQDVKALKRPHKDAIDAIDEAVRPWKTLIAERDQALQRALLAYQRHVTLAAEQANAKILERYEKKVDRLEAKAIMENKPMPLVLPPQMVSAPTKTVETEGAKQTVVRRKAWRLAGGSVRNPEELTADEAHAYHIPLSFFKLDTGRIGKVVRAGGTVPGIEVYDEESIAVKAL